MAQLGEQVPVRALVAQAAIEALDESVLYGLSRCDVVPLNLPVFLPLQNGIRRQFGPIIADHHAVIPTHPGDIIELRGNPLAGE